MIDYYAYKTHDISQVILCNDWASGMGLGMQHAMVQHGNERWHEHMIGCDLFCMNQPLPF